MTRLLAVLALSGALLRAQNPDELTAHLKAFPVLHVDFTQTRTLAALSRPLKSEGSMVLARDRGVIWQVRKPVALGFVVTPAGMAEVGRDGRPKPAKDAPVMARMGRIFQSMLQGRWGALDEFFVVRGEGSPGKWRILLSPRPQTAAFIKGVEVTGGPFLERVHVVEAGGDAMDLVFERPLTTAPLTGAEARLLGGE